MADESAQQNEKSTTCTFFKKAKRKGNVRKRKADSSGSEDETSVVRLEKRVAPNPLRQKTGTATRSWETENTSSRENDLGKKGRLLPG